MESLKDRTDARGPIMLTDRVITIYQLLVTLHTLIGNRNDVRGSARTYAYKNKNNPNIES